MKITEIESDDKYILEITSNELTVLEESLLRFCSYWNGFYYNQGIKIENNTDERTIMGNAMHTQIYEIVSKFF